MYSLIYTFLLWFSLKNVESYFVICSGNCFLSGLTAQASSSRSISGSRCSPLCRLTGLCEVLRSTCTVCYLCSWPLLGRLPSASPDSALRRLPGPATPRCSGRGGGSYTTTAPAETTERPSPTTASTGGCVSCSSTRNTPRVRSTLPTPLLL